MRKSLIVMFVGLTLGTLWWRCGEEGDPVGSEPPTRRADVARTDVPAIADRGGQPGPITGEMDAPPSLPSPSTKGRVAIDRGPARPGEDPERYRDRIEFARRFDAFAREAGLTDEQERALLLAFYDFLEQRRHVYRILAEERAKGMPLPSGFLVDMYAPSLRELILAEQEILTQEQREVYAKTCGYCAQGLALSEAMSGYDEPVLRLEGQDAR